MSLPPRMDVPWLQKRDLMSNQRDIYFGNFHTFELVNDKVAGGPLPRSLNIPRQPKHYWPIVVRELLQNCYKFLLEIAVKEISQSISNSLCG